METFSSRQLAAIAAGNKTVYWTFRITDINGSTYYWSTGNISSSGNDTSLVGIINAPDSYDNLEWESPHEFKIVNFSGISLRRNKSESGIHAPNDLTFTIVNTNNEYNYENFLGGTVRVNLIIKDDTGSEICGAWRFRIKGSAPYNQLIGISCEDFLQEYLKGTYPNTKLVDEIAPSVFGTSKDTLCIPEPYGTCYIPLRSIYADIDRYYVLGPNTYTYDISEVRSPRECGAKITWSSNDYVFEQSSYDAWRVFQPKIAEVNGEYSMGVFMSGSKILDMPTKFSRSDTVNITSPADIIRRVLWNMGVLDYDINIPSFEAAKATYASWGLAWNFAFWYKEDRTAVLSNLLAMCGSCLVIGERVSLQVLSKVSKMTVTEAYVLKPQEVGMDTFRYSATLQESASDSGYVAYQVEGESQDEFLSALVPAKTTTDVIDSETIIFAGVQNTEQVQRLGTLYYQRKFLKSGDVSFEAKGSCLALRPDDVITISYADYGGTYSVLIDEITIKPDIAISFGCQKFSFPLDDWGDLTPGAIVPGTNEPVNPYSVVVVGPDGTSSSGNSVNTLRGRLRIGEEGNYIVIEPASPIRVSVHEGYVEKLRIGNLNGFVGVVDDTFGLGVGSVGGFRAKFTATGCYIGDGIDQYMEYTVENGLVVRGNISADSITTGVLNLYTLVTPGTITGGPGGMIAANTIAAWNIVAGSISANEIASDYVYAGEISAYKITSGILSVDRILANSINGVHIGIQTILGGSGGNIALNTVVGGASGNLALRTITADNIAANTITANEIAADYIYAGEINADRILSGTLAAERISADYVYLGTINAIQINAGELNVDRIRANSIVSSKLYAYDPITGGYSEDLLSMLHLQDGSATASSSGFNPDPTNCPAGGSSEYLASCSIITSGKPIVILYTGMPYLPFSTQIILELYRAEGEGPDIVMSDATVNHLVNYETGVSQLVAVLSYRDASAAPNTEYTYSVKGRNPSETDVEVQVNHIMVWEMRR